MYALQPIFRAEGIMVSSSSVAEFIFSSHGCIMAVAVSEAATPGVLVNMSAMNPKAKLHSSAADRGKSLGNRIMKYTATNGVA